jgi:hypothetical protein
VETPVGAMTARGLVSVAAEKGRLRIRLVDIRLGQLPITGLLKLFVPTMESDINEYANSLLIDRTATAKVQLLGVRSDEDTLKFYLAGE